MPHNVLIALHALAGIGCFAAGTVSLRRQALESWWFRGYAVSLAALVSFMVAVIAVDWPHLDTSTRLIYGALLALGLYMLFRAWQAGNRLRRRGPGWRSRYVDDIGFTLISLFDGFVIVGAIDLHAPGWLVGVIAVAGVASGIQAIKLVKRRSEPEPAAA